MPARALSTKRSVGTRPRYRAKRTLHAGFGEANPHKRVSGFVTDDPADIVQQLLLIGRPEERLITPPRDRPEFPIEPAQRPFGLAMALEQTDPVQ